MLRNWLVHTYCTQQYFRHTVKFIESFRSFHGTGIFVSSRGLGSDQVHALIRLDNVIVNNQHLDVHDMTEETRTNLAVLHDYEKSIANREPPGKNLLWKLYISVKDRYRRSIDEALAFGHNILHFDADTLVKQPLDPLFKMIKRHDICIKFKDYDCKLGGVVGNLISFQNKPQTREFLNTWYDIIDKVKVHEMPRGFGQMSFYQAYRKNRDLVNFGRIPDSFSKRVGNKWISDYIEKIR